MSELSTFESRTGKLGSSAEDVFNFVTDIRNFERFIPPNTLGNVNLAEDSCSFQVSMLGTVNIHIREKTLYNEVVFSGIVPQVNNFSAVLKIKSTDKKRSEAKVILLAELNPILKMIAAEPVKQFLETLINEMEKFTGWTDTTKHNQPL
jgi:hypothetical protein